MAKLAPESKMTENGGLPGVRGLRSTVPNNRVAVLYAAGEGS